jgi:NADH dehydrogenase
MSGPSIHAVTGAFGYSGKYIAETLLAAGHDVITLTNSPERDNPLAGQVRAFPFHFEQPEKLTESLHGVSVLYNTYWVRFNHKTFTFADAVRNSATLFAAAKAAGVARIVHISITNPSLDSPLEYFRGKARVEALLQQSGLSHAILRPAVLFGREDILINNIAWMLRRLPLFGVFGSGRYRLQPIYVDDLAHLAVAQGSARENVIVNATGPETFTYRQLVRRIGEIIGKPRPIVSLPPALVYWFARLVGQLVGDVIVTRAEIEGLMAGLLYVNTPPTGKVRLTDWARNNVESLGVHYASELRRRKDRAAAYST